MKRFLFIALLVIAGSPSQSLASPNLRQQAAEAFALAQCNLDRAKSQTVGESVDEIEKQLKLARINGSNALDNLITGGRSLQVSPSFVKAIYNAMEDICPEAVRTQGKDASLENINVTLLATSLVLSWALPDLGSGNKAASQDKRLAPSALNKAQAHEFCKDARDYEGCVKVKLGNLQATSRLDRFGRPVMGANYVKYSNEDQDFYIHKTSAKSLEVRNSYGRYVSVNVAVKGYGNAGYTEFWATVRYDCDEKTMSFYMPKSGYRSEWEKKDSWVTPWIEKNLCANPAGFPKEKFIR